MSAPVAPATGSLAARKSPLADAVEQVKTLVRLGGPRFDDRLARDAGLHPLTATGIDVFQVNVGKLCNQTCRHCHVDAGPDRRESMSRETAELCMEALARTDIPTVDVTGGAPELNPSFRWIVERARALDRRVMDRCNLTVLGLPSQADLAEFFAANRVEVVASLPYFQAAETGRQRGDGVFEKSIRALKRLNELGYGRGDGLVLTLVHNPVGAFLPPPQAATQARFKDVLARKHGVVFDRLFTITNMPISRFLEYLVESGNLEGYMERLANAFNPAAARGVMCRTTISVGWDGTLYDCDFNQMLEMGLRSGAPKTIAGVDLEELSSREIAVGPHCFGCTAGAGSSCGGATT